MRRIISALLGLLLAYPAVVAAQQTSQKNQELLEAARKAREAKKNAPKAKYVFTNDNIPKSGTGVSVVGTTPPSPAPSKAGAAAAAEEEKKSDEDKRKEEAEWRKKFAEARARLATAEKELDILQRELNLNQQQYYSDPNVAMREQYTRTDINKGRAAIDAKKIEIDQLKKTLETLEDELRRAGLPAGWARP
ncbi:MAG TPA: hypothetical protein VGQ11_12140 [Candidatus Acidoferrales bacterium]|nr:hypothetical protein [Candidatus Acidoferrales bacterium]